MTRRGPRAALTRADEEFRAWAENPKTTDRDLQIETAANIAEITRMVGVIYAVMILWVIVAVFGVAAVILLAASGD